ncbi:hypothetical protein KWJ70_003758, partial [Salmonella enterica subsp. enterica]|nr:hypothetical protein [Salmonella enterica subsp. enterica]
MALISFLLKDDILLSSTILFELSSWEEQIFVSITHGSLALSKKLNSVALSLFIQNHPVVFILTNNAGLIAIVKLWTVASGGINRNMKTPA